MQLNMHVIEKSGHKPRLGSDSYVDNVPSSRSLQCNKALAGNSAPYQLLNTHPVHRVASTVAARVYGGTRHKNIVHRHSKKGEYLVRVRGVVALTQGHI